MVITDHRASSEVELEPPAKKIAHLFAHRGVINGRETGTREVTRVIGSVAKSVDERADPRLLDPAQAHAAWRQRDD